MQEDVKKAFEIATDIDKNYFLKWLLMQARKDVMVKQSRTEELVRKEMVSNSLQLDEKSLRLEYRTSKFIHEI